MNENKENDYYPFPEDPTQTYPAKRTGSGYSEGRQEYQGTFRFVFG